MRALLAAACGAVLLACQTPGASVSTQASRAVACDPDDAGLQLPPGFCGSVFASGLVRPRHMAVAPNGDVFVISNRGRGGGAGDVQPGVYRLRDADGDGRAETRERVADGMGTGIALAHGALYAESGTGAIVRHALRAGTTDLAGTADTIVSGLPMSGGHFQRNFVIRGDELFVDNGSATNACEAPGGRGGGPAPAPCVELETRAGIWRFSATRTGQQFSPAQRYATGFRNAVALTLDPRTNQLYAVQHGRDNLGPIMGRTAEYNAENPGEELHRIVQGADYGWPYCYWSHEHGRKVLAPEYGGDGSQVGRCAAAVQPIYAFPGHWAPNDALFYTGTQFPASYRDGIFVAFHGSWNRAPLPQAGFNVTFLPLRDGRAAGTHQVFADGFNARRTPDAPATARSHRPTGLAQLPDGSLLVADDAGGTIFRIAYRGR